MGIRQWPEKTQKFFKEVKVEMQKVSWPTRQSVTGSMIAVLVAVAALTVLLWGIDTVFGKILTMVLPGPRQ